jgi:murein tripeptide amidase MpaA
VRAIGRESGVAGRNERTEVGRKQAAHTATLPGALRYPRVRPPVACLPLRFDHLYSYDELSAALHELAAERPDLMALEVAGTSHEGRDVWLATVTNTATGPHHEKPAVWVDANIHAVEITGSTAALHLLHRLVNDYGTDERVTRALDTRTFYVVPRVNPDGVEVALAASPAFIRSSTRKWPRTDEADGLVQHDIDGDGRILTMRLRDANGAWKTHETEPRLMVPRRPDDPVDGEYYRILDEGTIRNYDGVLIANAPERRSLDLNRNFPAGWRTESEQHGAGPYPVSEPEVRNLVDALVARPNVCAYFAYHTYSAVNLRPYDDRPDDQMPEADLNRYKRLGEWGKDITGYDAVSVYHDFRYDRGVITGAADSWAYDHLGIYGWTTEFWSMLRAAGVKPDHLIHWFEDHPVDDDLALLRWSDETTNGTAFVDWYPFEHPQLGPVELGGWDWLRSVENPPPQLMEAEIKPHADFAILHALSTPLLALHSVDVEAVGDGVYRLRVVVHNTGWMPTHVSERAVDRKVARPIEATITLPDGATLVQGKTPVELGQLAGWSRAVGMLSWNGPTDDTSDRAKVEWVVRAPAGSVVPIEIRHTRAGIVRTEVALP